MDRRFACAVLAVGLLGCDGGIDAGTSGASEGPNPGEGFVEIGWGVDAFHSLAPGDDLPIVLGSQGLAMFAIAVRCGGIVVPEDPADYLDPAAPLLDLYLDVEGHNDDPSGHFRRIVNYALPLDTLADGTYEFMFVALILPDDLEPASLEGLPARLSGRLRPYRSDPLAFDEPELTVRVEIDPPPPGSDTGETGGPEGSDGTGPATSG